jgi:glycosyltransferase involved in cell wall biosynthesis
MARNKKRIGLYCLYGQNAFIHTSQKLGGAEKQSALWARFLAEKGYAVAFLMADPGSKKKVFTLYPGIEAHYHPKYGLTEGDIRKRKFSAGWLSKIKDKIRKSIGLKPINVADLNKKNALRPFIAANVELWVGQYLSDPLFELAQACKEKSIPFLLALAHDVDLDFIHLPKGRDKFGACREKKRETMGMATAVLVQNRWQELEMLRYFPDKPTFYLPNPIALDTPSKLSLQNKNGILWIGKFDSNKNPTAFLQLALNLPDVPFLMIANPSNPEIEQEIRKNCPSNLNIISAVPYEEIGTFFEKAAIHISTSLLEGFPNTFLEAAAHLTPTFSLHVDPDELMSKGILGHCFSGNIEKMAEAIQTGLNNKGQLFEMGKNAREYVEKVHDSDVVSREWLNIVEQVLQLPCAE